MLVVLFHFQDTTDRNMLPLSAGDLYPDKNGNKLVCNDDSTRCHSQKTNHSMKAKHSFHVCLEHWGACRTVDTTQIGKTNIRIGRFTWFSAALPDSNHTGLHVHKAGKITSRLHSVCCTNQRHNINYILILKIYLRHVSVKVYHLQGAQWF
jgi:hypothetical protein